MCQTTSVEKQCKHCERVLVAGQWLLFKNHTTLPDVDQVACPVCELRYEHRSLYL